MAKPFRWAPRSRHMRRARLPTDPSSFIASLPDGTNAASQKINLSHLDDNTFPQVIMLHHFEKADRVNCTFLAQPGSLCCDNACLTTCLTVNLEQFALLTPLVFSVNYSLCMVPNICISLQIFHIQPHFLVVKD